MKAIEILDCILYMGISGEDLYRIEVPAEDDEYTPQTEEWWMDMVGGVPPKPIPNGNYIIFYPTSPCEWLRNDDIDYKPDYEIEHESGNFYLYKMED